MIIAKEHFFAQVDIELAKSLFSQAVDELEIGISSYCNRTCSYCPNSFVDRRSAKNYMSDELFFSILNSLREIDYRRTISLHRYNEPMADYDYLLKRISQIRAQVPNAQVRLFTNGDYLTRERLDTLCELGLTQITVTVHDDDFGKAKARQEQLLGKLGVEYRYREDTALSRIAHVSAAPLIEVGAKNFHYDFGNGTYLKSDRGQSISLEGGSRYVRKHPCFTPFWDVQIEWDGAMLPCCHIHTDVPEHQDYVLARLTPETNLFLAWSNQAYANWRRSVFNFDDKIKPCRGCYADLPPDTEEVRNYVKAFTEAFLKD